MEVLARVSENALPVQLSTQNAEIAERNKVLFLSAFSALSALKIDLEGLADAEMDHGVGFVLPRTEVESQIQTEYESAKAGADPESG